MAEMKTQYVNSESDDSGGPCRSAYRDLSQEIAGFDPNAAPNWTPGNFVPGTPGSPDLSDPGQQVWDFAPSLVNPHAANIFGEEVTWA